MKNKLFIRRVIMTIVGVLGGGVCVGLFRMSLFGVDPFQAFMSGIDEIFPNITFGTLYVVINGILLLFALFLDRKKIGLGTFVNLFLLGYVVEFSHLTFLHFFPTVTLWMRIAFLASGVVIICITSALYFTANLGVSTYDAVALILAARLKKIPFKFWRIMTDLLCVIIGVSLFLTAGNSWSHVTTIIGIGTIISAFFMGPLIAFFNQRIAEPLLYRGIDEQIKSQ